MNKSDSPDISPDLHELTLRHAFDDDLAAFLSDRLTEHNLETTGIDDARGLTVTSRDAEGDLIGGLSGFTWGGLCKVRLLWVREDQRGRGLGSRLMDAAEAEAMARGCRQVVLETHSFQAPEFYQARGYRIVGTVEDYPQGYQYFMLVKRLT
jgi:ribosomal protein S18 acetylase RimI-like enzyme